MKKFDIITEADARVLTRGETVMLARGGHVTPLALDTLGERRITLVHEGRVSADEASLVYVGVAKNFGKGVGFALGLIFLGIIFFPILGFGDATYTKPAAA